MCFLRQSPFQSEVNNIIACVLLLAAHGSRCCIDCTMHRVHDPRIGRAAAAAAHCEGLLRLSMGGHHGERHLLPHPVARVLSRCAPGRPRAQQVCGRTLLPPPLPSLPPASTAGRHRPPGMPLHTPKSTALKYGVRGLQLVPKISLDRTTSHYPLPSYLSTIELSRRRIQCPMKA